MTAIQELIQEMEELREDNIYPESFQAIDECIHLCYSKLEMEKEQIIRTWYDCKMSVIEKNPTTADEYYNQNFKSE